MPHSPEHPEAWPATPWVIRTRIIKLEQREAYEEVDLYQCQYPDGVTPGAFRMGPVRNLKRDRETLQLIPNTSMPNNRFEGTLHMHLVPGQPADGQLRCRAGKFADREPTFSWDAYQAWKLENPDSEPDFTITYSAWSNTVPLGEVAPDPVPEPGVITMLIVGIIGLGIASWRSARRTKG